MPPLPPSPEAKPGVKRSSRRDIAFAAGADRGHISSVVIIGLGKLLKITIDFSNPEDDCIIVSEKDKLPYPMLNPSEEFKLIASYDTSEAPQLVPIKMKWKNMDGTYSEYNSVLQP